MHGFSTQYSGAIFAFELVNDSFGRFFCQLCLQSPEKRGSDENTVCVCPILSVKYLRIFVIFPESPFC